MKRKFQQEMEPAMRCYRLISAPNRNCELPEIQFAVADIQELLRYIASTVPSFATFLRNNCTGQVILSHDETTAGNVLNTDASQKAVLFYCTFCDLQQVHESPRAWLPIGAITHRQTNQVLGSLSKVHSVFLEEWNRQTQQPLLLLPDVNLKLTLHCMVSDLDAQRLALCAKGSAGLKPCAFCRNVLSRSAEETAEHSGEQFVSIHEHDVRKFQKHTQAQIQNYMSRVLRDWPNMSKAERDMRERCLGFNIGVGAMWESDIACATLPIDRFVNDSMHCYFANGCCSSEILLLLQEVKRHLGTDIAAIRQAVLDSKWQRPGHLFRRGENDYWTKRLFTEQFFTGSLYKGGAKQTQALLFLIRWLAERLWLSIPALAPQAKSFLKLCKCVDCIRRISVLRNYDALSQLQSEHQKAFVELYPDSTRPKHHARLHLPEQYHRLGCQPNCWGTESKHRDYKGVFAPTVQHFLTEQLGGAQFSRQLLPRLLMRHCEMLRENPIEQFGYKLHDPFGEQEVKAKTGLDNCSVAARCTVNMLELLAENDIIMWGNDLTKSGRCHFFLEKTNNLFIYMTEGRLVKATEAMRSFQFTGPKTVLSWSQLLAPALPTWIRSGQNDFVHCLI